MDFLGKRRGTANGMVFWIGNSLHGSGMAITPWQSAPGAATAPLNDGRTEPCRDKLASALGSVMGSGIAPATVKILQCLTALPKKI